MNDTEDKPIESVEELIEEVVPGLSETEYRKIREEALEKAKAVRHQWVMKGRGSIVCKSCEFPHASYVPMNKQLVGIDESTGLPILRDMV